MTTQLSTTVGRCPVCPSGTVALTIGSAPDFEYRTTGDVEWTIVACNRCETRLLDPCPADEMIASLYPPEYEPYRFDDLPALIRRARDRVQRNKVARVQSVASHGSTILDLGCGNGNLLRLLRRFGDPSWTLIGWDFPGAHLDRLRTDGFDVIASPIEGDDDLDLRVDVIILNQVIEHFREPQRVIGLCAQMLEPGGRLVIETPDVGGLDARIFRSRYWGGYHVPRHLVLFSGPGLRELLESWGFNIVHSASLLSPAFWVQSWHHWLSERVHGRRLAQFLVVRNPVALAAAVLLDVITIRFAPTSNQLVIAEKTDRPVR